MKVVIGIDIGGTNTVFGIIDSEGKCLALSSISTNEYDNPEIFVSFLARAINKLIVSLPFNTRLAGIGIGAPNGNFYKGTVEFAPNLRWKGIINLVRLVKEFFNVPVILTNDANAAAIGEMLYGAAKGMKDFIAVTLGTGVGSGFVVNGKLVYGHDGFAGELGHTIVYTNGRECGCGRKGCLETYASATGITRTAVEMLGNSSENSILRNYSASELNSKIICEAAVCNDKIATEAFNYTGKILGLKLADAIAITSPEAIILSGGLTLAGDLILKPVRHYMEYYLLEIFKNKISLLTSTLNSENAAVLGAASLVWNEAAK